MAVIKTKKTGREAYSRRPVKKAPLTPIQKKEIAAKKKEEAELFEAAGRTQEAQFADLAEQIGKPIEYVRLRFNQVSLVKRTKRKATAYNAFLHKKAAAVANVSGRRKMPAMSSSADLKAEYESLTQAERDGLVQDLEQHRWDKENTGHHLAKAQATDVDKFAQDFQLKLTGLENRCDVEHITVIVNRNPRVKANTKLLMSENIALFMKERLNCTPEDFAVALEGWAVGRGPGTKVSGAGSDKHSALTTEARRLLRENWEEVVGDVKIVYNAHTALNKYNVEFIGWPGGPPNFQKLGKPAKLKKLIELVKSGEATWRKVPADQLEERRQALAEDPENVPPEPRKERSDKNTTRARNAPLGDMNLDL